MIKIDHALHFRFHDRDFYLGLIDLKELALNSTVDAWSSKNQKGYQRNLKKNRSKKFADYLNQPNSFFHQTILLNARNKSKVKFKGKNQLGTLKISDFVYLVDGQHRTGGLKMHLEANPSAGETKVPVLVMVGFDRNEEAREFLIVNKTQKGSRTDLADRILSDVIEELDKPMLEVLGFRESQSVVHQLMTITDLLNGKKDSVWYKRITLPNEKTQKTESIKQRSFSDSLKPVLKDNYISTNYKNSNKLVKVLVDYWNVIKSLCPKATGKKFKEFVLLKTTGAFVMNRLFPIILIKSGKNPTKAKMKHLLEKIEEMNDDSWSSNGELGDYGTSQRSFE